MAMNFSPNPEKQKALINKLTKLGIDKKDVIEKFIRAGGPGGQNVNKNATCVYLKHPPTGTEVKMARERSQALNRFLAWRLLAEKVAEKTLKVKSDKRKRIEKIRRQKRKRSRRAKEKMLQAKKKHSHKKRLRRISSQDLA